MCEQTEISYLDGEVVWVKLGSCWWPGEVVGSEKLPPDVLPSFRKPPIAVVKFFQESTYEYVKNINAIYKYNCSRKDEFIRKGLYMFRTKHGHMEKFPEDVIRAETETGGDPDILSRDEFQEAKKESYAGIFGSASKKALDKTKGRGRPSLTPKNNTSTKRITRDKADYKVHILVQGSKTPSQSTETVSTPSTSRAESESEPTEERTPTVDKPPITFSTPTSSASGVYPCPLCSFTTTRLNVLILHNKTHSATFTPYTPSPVRKKPVVKSSSKATPNKTPKARKPRERTKTEKTSKKPQAQKRVSEEQTVNVEVKKVKTDEEIKSSLLADWDDMDEDSNDKSPSVSAATPEAPNATDSIAEPTPAELPNAQIPADVPSTAGSKSEDLTATEKPEPSSDSKYEFCEDEDWSMEADAGRKIPRVKNPSKQKEHTKSISIDEDDVAREVAELLKSTTVPELPSAPESLKVEENFPEPSIVKSPDKNVVSIAESSKPADKQPTTQPAQPIKAIFKTKTFFRSRHSRSQDAIGKYVAEQLNAAERMDVESDLNGSDVVSSPEARESPPIEQVKVARLAPKIQLKKMKAEAAQLREKEKILGKIGEDELSANGANTNVDSSKENNIPLDDNELAKTSNTELKQDYVVYPTQKIELPSSVPEDNKHVREKDNDNIGEDKCDESVPTLGNTTCNNNENSGHANSKTKDVVPNVSKTVKDGKKCFEPFMTETTASAVDALLSVSRETDRVTKNISDDPPEDLFEDDNKDNNISNNLNGFNEEIKQFSEHKDNALIPEDKIQFQPDETKEPVKEIVPMEKDQTDCETEVMDTDDQDNSHKMTYDNKNDETSSDTRITEGDQETKELESRVDNAPSESDLQIAEALINLPSTAIQNKASLQDNINLGNHFTTVPFPEETAESTDKIEVIDNEKMKTVDMIPAVIKDVTDTLVPIEGLNTRFETELEKSENLNAAQSLVQMSESVDHKIKLLEPTLSNIDSLTPDNVNLQQSLHKNNSVEQKLASLSSDNSSDPNNSNKVKFDTSSSKLLKILEEPTKVKVFGKTTPTKQVVVTGKEKILNFDVSKTIIKSKPQSPKQKIIIRRNTPSKNIINSLNEIASQEKIILSRSNKPPQDGSSVQTYTIQATPETSSDANTIIIQQKVRKIAKSTPKLNKLKQQPALMAPTNETKSLLESSTTDDTLYDINSMPIVLSDDITTTGLTPENIEKMPMVMSDGKIITNSTNPPKLVKTKNIESEKLVIHASPNKPELKTLLMNPVSEVSKVTTPNILSKSSKLRGSKPMLVIDKATGKQKIIMTKSETPVKEIKQTPTKLQPIQQSATKTGKFIILPTAAASPRPNRTQKIVIDPQTGKAHVLVAKSSDPQLMSDNKPVSAKLIPQASDTSSPGNTVMIITNAQGAQSRIVLTPEHEKILFPNKQQPKISQLKTVTHRLATNPTITQKTIVTSVAPAKTQTTKIVPKQKSAIITSKGQLIVGGRVATTAQNIAPMPEIRPAPKRIIATEPKTLAQTVQKTSPEPLIFLQQKSGAVMQLTAAQFEHLQRTGQIIQKSPAVAENKIVVQKSITIPPNESIGAPALKKARRPASASPAPAKRLKQEIAIAPAPSPSPALAPLSNAAVTTLVASTASPAPLAPLAPLAPPPAPHASHASSYPDLDHLDELLPSTAIVRQPEPAAAPATSAVEAPPPPAPLSDGQLLAVPGEHFGGPPGSFYLCVEDNGSLTPIDNRPLVLENNQLVPMAPEATPTPERRDILEAALANSDVFHEPPRDEAPDFRDLNANVSVHCRVSETSTTLNQPIMTPAELPVTRLADAEPAVPANLEDGLAVIGVTPHSVPTSLELPITVTDPRIAPRAADPLAAIAVPAAYTGALLAEPEPEPELAYAAVDETAAAAAVGAPGATGGISMPLLMEEEAVGGKSMPLLTEELAASSAGSSGSVESTGGEEGAAAALWSRRLLTPGSDTSEASAEIPLQPHIQLSVGDVARDS